jgi:hypothetical protein
VYPAFFPVTVTVDEPTADFLFADICRVEVPVAVTVFGLNEDDVLDGTPEILSATELDTPFTAVTVTVSDPLELRFTTSVDALVEIVKSAGTVSVTVVECVSGPSVPVMMSV